MYYFVSSQECLPLCVRLYPETIWNGAPTPYPPRLLTHPISQTKFNLPASPEITEWISFFLFKGNSSSHPSLCRTCSLLVLRDTVFKISPSLPNIFSLVIFRSSLLSAFEIKQT